MADKNKKLNIFQRFGKGFKGVISELKKVVWPSKEKLKNTSAVVLVVILFFAILLTIIGEGGRWVLDKVGFYDQVETTVTTAVTESSSQEA
ncbi:MAG: preprotein translocase subunit SecE [Saccharofermentans sp.]|nr:preprotein translocase subunit SecE [Saccharofermentans sp.]